MQVRVYDHKKYFWQFEDAAKEVADEVTRPRPTGEEEIQDIQIMLRSDANPVQVRQLKVCNIQCPFNVLMV